MVTTITAVLADSFRITEYSATWHLTWDHQFRYPEGRARPLMTADTLVAARHSSRWTIRVRQHRRS
jgi:hypothetical protein